MSASSEMLIKGDNLQSGQTGKSPEQQALSEYQSLLSVIQRSDDPVSIDGSDSRRGRCRVPKSDDVANRLDDMAVERLTWLVLWGVS